MWALTGRSGYGNSTIGGDYDSWDGISPNGRQYKNEATMETRDLSGADYWHLRKQNRPTEEIPSSLHMLNKDRANIDAYATLDAPVKKTVKKAPLRDRISLADRHFNRIEALSLELDSEWKAGNIDSEEYYELRAKMNVRLDKAWKRLEKENGWADEETEQALSHTLPPKSATQPEFMQEKRENSVKKAVHSAKTDLIKFVTGSLVCFIGLMFLKTFM